MEDSLSFGGCLKNKIHYLPIRVYYADTDCGGVVHHSRYVEYLERGRTEALRAFGIVECSAAQAGAGGEAIILPIISLNLTYKAPARRDDIVIVETRIEKIMGARLYAEQKIYKDELLLVRAECCMALVTADVRPRRIPDSWHISLFDSKE